MRSIELSIIALALSGCSFSPQVHQFSVDYHTALSGVNNTQTLKNILYAKDGLPGAYTAIAQFRGSININAGASLNSQIRGAGLTDVTSSGSSSSMSTTRSVTTLIASPDADPSTTAVNSSVASPGSTSSFSRTMAEGVDTFTPQISGQFVSGTNFDVDVYANTKFTNGMLSAVPFSLVESYLASGVENKIVFFLSVARVDFTIKESYPGFPAGTTLRSFVNELSDASSNKEFMDLIECYELGTKIVPRKSTRIIALSRITRGPDGATVPLPLDKLSVVDGEKLEFSHEAVPGKTDHDNEIYLNRVNSEHRMARFSQRPEKCKGPEDKIIDLELPNGVIIKAAVPVNPPSKAIYLGEGYAALNVENSLNIVPVNIDITFRPPEGIYKFVGEYLSGGYDKTILIDKYSAFNLAEGRNQDYLVQVKYRKKIYSLINEDGSKNRNARVFSMLQQIVDLQKEASERPMAVPVRAIP